MNLNKTFANKKVIVTGHTGFKGSWLTLWLTKLGANVLGISKNIPTQPSHFDAIKIKKKINHRLVDINNLAETRRIFKNFQPSFVFHLAAQSLVSKSYENPFETFHTNSMGTLNILESLKKIKKKCVVIIITSDKVYKNIEINKGYKENDVLGGKDPYSGSKAAAENIINSYIHSYFTKSSSKILLSIARAGNVIGGGDWSKNRIVPDCMKSWSRNSTVTIRNPNSTRPWQHVLEAVGGYLILATKLNINKKLHGHAFNFGPSNKNNFKVIDLIKKLSFFWNDNGKIKIKIKKSDKVFFESKLLKLNSNKIKKFIKWKSVLNFEETSFLVSNWYKNFYENKSKIRKVSLDQIKFYENCLKKRIKNL